MWRSRAPGSPSSVMGVHPADRAVPRTDQNSMLAHAELLEKRRKGRIDLYFLGDSITDGWLKIRTVFERSLRTL